MRITYRTVTWSWYACYDPARLEQLYRTSKTPLQVLTKIDGVWKDVPAIDRLWTVLHKGVLEAGLVRSFLCDCAQETLKKCKVPQGFKEACRIFIRAIRTFIKGKIPYLQLYAARHRFYESTLRYSSYKLTFLKDVLANASTSDIFTYPLSAVKSCARALIPNGDLMSSEISIQSRPEFQAAMKRYTQLLVRYIEGKRKWQ